MKTKWDVRIIKSATGGESTVLASLRGFPAEVKKYESGETTATLYEREEVDGFHDLYTAMSWAERNVR